MYQGGEGIRPRSKRPVTLGKRVNSAEAQALFDWPGNVPLRARRLPVQNETTEVRP
jgi:hypothetical protein